MFESKGRQLIKSVGLFHKSKEQMVKTKSADID